MTRIPLLPPASTNPDVAPIFDRLRQKWGEVLNLYRALAWSPPLTRAWGAFASSLRFDLGASRRLRELLIVQIARQLGATYEYEHHKEMAKDEGFTAAQLDALPGWSAEPSFTADERLILRLGDELAAGPGASAETMRALRERFGERDLMEILVTGAFYCGVARVINSLDLELEPGHDRLRPKKD